MQQSNNQKQQRNMCSSFKKVTHCIFDLDGLLLDTEKLYTEATEHILEKYDKKYSWEIKMSVMGMQHMDICRRMVEHYDLPITPEEYSKLQRQYNEIHMQKAELMPDSESIQEQIVREILNKHGKSYPLDLRFRVLGAPTDDAINFIVKSMKLPITPAAFKKQYNDMCKERLVDLDLKEGAARIIKHFHRNGIPMCIATSSSEDMVQLKITNHCELFNMFNHRVCGSSDPAVKRGKPAPDIFLVAASRFPDKPSPDNCLVFEDAPNGVAAAVSAGMQVVMVPDSRISKDLCKCATCCINSLRDFQPELFGLPSFYHK